MAQGNGAGGDDVVIGIGRHGAGVEHHRDALARYGCIGYEDDGAATGPEAQQRVACRLEGAVAIVQDAPDVAEHDVVA